MTNIENGRLAPCACGGKAEMKSVGGEVYAACTSCGEKTGIYFTPEDGQMGAVFGSPEEWEALASDLAADDWNGSRSPAPAKMDMSRHLRF
jgi:hypothetical protein